MEHIVICIHVGRRYFPDEIEEFNKSIELSIKDFVYFKIGLKTW